MMHLPLRLRKGVRGMYALSFVGSGFGRTLGLWWGIPLRLALLAASPLR